MQRLLSIDSINRGAGGCIPMFDSLDDKITSIRRRIEKFKKDYPELYESEINEQRKSQQHTTGKGFSQAEELKRTLYAQKKSTTI